MFASVFVLLYAAHLLSDYPLQTDHQAAHKASHGDHGWRANLSHAGTHVLVTWLALGAGALLLDDVTLTPGRTLLALAWVGVTHSVIDRRWPIAWWMRRAGQTEWAKHGGAAHVDQTAHVTALVIAALILSA